MAISEVHARAVRLPLERPTRISTRELPCREYLIVTVLDDHGLEGIGYAYAGTSAGRLLATAVDDLLTPLLVGADQQDIVGTWERMYRHTLLEGRRGAVLRAVSAVDIALWDLAAKRCGVPLATLLGGPVGPVDAYASGGYYRPGDGSWADAVRAEIASNLDLGFTSHKIKVGGLTVAEDASRVAAAAELIGGDGRLALDANNSYTSVADAEVALDAFERAAEDTGLWWFEEPLSPDDPAGHARLRERSRTPIATGEIAATRWEFRDLLERGSADVLQPDAGVLGGVTEFLRVAKAADTFGIPIAPHWHANLHVHLAASDPNCLAVEHFVLDKDIYNFETLLVPPARLEHRGGQVYVPDRPGIGIELDPAAVQRFSI